MAVPKRRKSHSRTRTARAHKHIKPPQMGYCSNCNQARLPHRVCANCGYYNGRQVIAKDV